jgi:hypothetical protein
MTQPSLSTAPPLRFANAHSGQATPKSHPLSRTSRRPAAIRARLRRPKHFSGERDKSVRSIRPTRPIKGLRVVKVAIPALLPLSHHRTDSRATAQCATPRVERRMKLESVPPAAQRGLTVRPSAEHTWHPRSHARRGMAVERLVRVPISRQVASPTRSHRPRKTIFGRFGADSAFSGRR